MSEIEAPQLYRRPLLPIYIKNHSRQTFLMDSRVPDRVVTTAAGTFRTRPLRAGGAVDLLAVCAVHEIAEHYPNYLSDRLDGSSMSVQSLFVTNVHGEMVELEVNVPFLPDPEGNVNDWRTWDNFALPVKYGEKPTKDCRLAARFSEEFGTFAWSATMPQGWNPMGILLKGDIVSRDHYLTQTKGRVNV